MTIAIREVSCHDGPVGEDAQLVSTIDELDAALAENIERSIEVRRRLMTLRTEAERSGSVLAAIEAEPTPRTVELLTENVETLHSAGARLRAAQALALRAEGLTIEAIADLFGVTRQRISALLRQRAADEVTNSAG